MQVDCKKGMRKGICCIGRNYVFSQWFLYSSEIFVLEKWCCIACNHDVYNYGVPFYYKSPFPDITESI